MKIKIVAALVVLAMAEEKGGKIRHDNLRATRVEITSPQGVTYQKFKEQFEDFQKFDKSRKQLNESEKKRTLTYDTLNQMFS